MLFYGQFQLTKEIICKPCVWAKKECPKSLLYALPELHTVACKNVQVNTEWQTLPSRGDKVYQPKTLNANDRHQTIDKTIPFTWHLLARKDWKSRLFRL